MAVSNGQTPNGTGLIISSSRGILYASSDDNFGSAARAATEALRAARGAAPVARREARG